MLHDVQYQADVGFTEYDTDIFDIFIMDANGKIIGNETVIVAQSAEDDTHEYKRLRLDTPSDSLMPMYNLLAGTASSNIRLIGSVELPHSEPFLARCRRRSGES